jgi:hypothetical protein
VKAVQITKHHWLVMVSNWMADYQKTPHAIGSNFICGLTWMDDYLRSPLAIIMFTVFWSITVRNLASFWSNHSS